MNPSTRLREMRKAAGLSQAELAERTGVSQPAISQIENDVLAMDVAWMRAFARVLGCKPADLLSDDDNPDRLTDDERAIIASYRAASGDQRTIIERVAAPISPFRHQEEKPMRQAG